MPITVDDVDFDLKLAEFRINGFVVFEDMIDPARVDRVHEAFKGLMAGVVARETAISASQEHGEVATGRGRQNMKGRYTMTIPWVEPFADPAIYEHPVVLEFLDRYWQTDDYVITCSHSNTPYPGTDFQHWHRDTKMGSELPGVYLGRVPVVGVKYPLVDTSEANGSIEVLPCTQYLAEGDLEGRYHDLLTTGDFSTTRRLNLKKGSMWIQDVRTLHRGTANPSDAPRPEIVTCYCKRWFAIDQHVELTREAYAALSERGKRMLKRWAAEP